jgi:hypothetical protein
MLAAVAGSASTGSGNVAPMLAASPSAHDHIVIYKRIGTIVFLAISIPIAKTTFSGEMRSPPACLSARKIFPPKRAMCWNF